MFNSNNTKTKKGFLTHIDSFGERESRIYTSKKYRLFSFGASAAFVIWALYTGQNMIYVLFGVLFIVLNIISFFLRKWRESRNEEQWLNEQIEYDNTDWDDNDASDET